MNDDEWRAVCLHLELGWKGDMSEERRGVYATFLKGLDFGVATAVLRRLAESGQPWLPTVPEITKAVRDLTEPQVPSWSEAWSMIERAMKMHPTAVGAFLAGLPPVVVAFVEAEKLSRLRSMGFYDPERGEMLIHQLGKRFAEFADVWQARESRALAAAGITAIGAARRELTR